MTCKNCGAELPEDARFCRRCGTEVTPDVPLQELEKEDTQLTSPATDVNDDENTDNNTDGASSAMEADSDASITGSPEAAAPADGLSGQNVVFSDNINSDQLEAFQSGQPLTFVAGEDSAAPDASGKKKPKKPPKQPKLPKQPKPPKPPKAVKIDRPSKRRRPHRAKVIRSKAARSRNPFAMLTAKLNIPGAVVSTVLFVCVAAAAFVLGFLTHYYNENLQYQTETNQQAIAALDVLMQTFPTQKDFQADDLYVKSGNAKTEVIIFGRYGESSGTSEQIIFRVVKENGGYTVVYPFDETLYNLLNDSGDPKDHITAAAMKSHEETLNMDLRELESGSPMWQQADSPYVCYVVYRDYTKNRNIG
jgi:hypothetical protein